MLLGAVPPLTPKTPANPEGQPIGGFGAIRAGVAADRSQLSRDLRAPWDGANRLGAAVSQGGRGAFWRMSMQAGLEARWAASRPSPSGTSPRTSGRSTSRP